MIFTRIGAFTLFLRRFQSHYWDSDDNLHFTRWWQWGRRCFFVRDRIINKPFFSTWEQIKSRAGMNDKDALLIQQCITRLSVHINKNLTPEEIYSQMIEFTKQPN